MFKSIFCKLLLFVCLFSILPVQAKSKIKNVKVKNTSQQLLPIDKLSGTFNNEIKIVFCDIDGTIIPKNYPKGQVPDSVKQASKKLREANIPMVLATGRTYPEAKKIADIIGIKNSYFVTMQGSAIIDDKGNLIYKDCIKSDDAKRILKALDKYTKTNAPKAKIYFYINENPKSTKIFILPYYWQTVAIIKSYDCLGNFTPGKIGIYENNPVKLRAIKDFLKTNFPEYDSYLSTDCFCELTTFNANKGNGVKQVTNALNIDLKNVATFGDAENDLSMSKLVKNSGGLAVSVKNAMDILKQNTNYETKSVNDGGVNYAVDKIIENNKLLAKKKSANCIK